MSMRKQRERNGRSARKETKSEYTKRQMERKDYSS